MSLFRPEALAERTAPQWGTVIVSRSPALGWASLLIVLIALLGLSLVLNLDYATKVQVAGYLEPQGGIAEIIAPAAGRVAALNVGDEDQVQAGQVLIVLDHDRYSEEGRQVHLQEAVYLKASIQRLKQRAIADSEQQASERRALISEIDHLAQEQAALNEELRLVKQQRALLSKSEERLAKLLSARLVAAAIYDQERQRTLSLAQSESQVRRALAAIERQLGQAREALVRLAQEHDAERLTLEQKQADLARQLVRLAEQRQTAIVAPRSGVVTFVQFMVGDRVAPEQVLMTVAPDHGRTDLVLLADVNAATELAVGDEVRFKALGGKRSRNPIGAAIIRELSQTPQKPHRLQSWVAVSGPVFRARAEVSRFPEDFPQRGGMRVDAFVVTKSRTLWRWLVQPLTSAVAGL